MVLNFSGGLFERDATERFLGQKPEFSTFRCFAFRMPFAVGFTATATLQNVNIATKLAPFDFIPSTTEITIDYTNFVGASATLNFKIAPASAPTNYFLEEQITIGTGQSGSVSLFVPVETFVPGTPIKIRIDGEGADLYGTEAGSNFLSSWNITFTTHGRYV